MPDPYGFDKSDDQTVYLGEIELVVDFGVFVALNGRSDLVHHSNIPGCESEEDLPRVCKRGDKMRVRITHIDYRRDKMKLECVEFPVKDSE